MVDTRNRNQVATLPQIAVSNTMRVSHCGFESIPTRHRMAIGMAATTNTRRAP
jgi:hypothetical protein